MTTLLAQSVDQMRDIAPTWRSAQAAVGLVTPNADPHRFEAALRALDCESPYIVVIQDADDSPAGLIAGRVVTRSVSMRLGYCYLKSPRLRCLDIVYGGLLATAPDMADVVAAHLREVLKAGVVQHVMINMLPVDSPLFRSLSHDDRLLRFPGQPHWVIDLPPEGFDVLMKRRSSKTRKKFRQQERKLERDLDGSATLRTFRTVEDIEPFIELASSIASQTYQSAIANYGVRDDAVTRELLHVEATAGRVLAYVLTVNDVPLAYQNGFVYDGVYHLFGTGYTPEHQDLRPGGILFLRLLEHLCSEGLRTVDFGFGDADYKHEFGTRSWDESTIHLYASGLTPSLAYGLDRTIDRANRTAEFILSPAIRQRVKQGWRRRLAIR